MDGKLRHQPAQHLGENDARIAPRAHERAVGDRLAHLGHLGVIGQGPSSAATDSMVSVILVPVSPSGTG